MAAAAYGPVGVVEQRGAADGAGGQAVEDRFAQRPGAGRSIVSGGEGVGSFVPQRAQGDVDVVNDGGGRRVDSAAPMSWWKRSASPAG